MFTLVHRSDLTPSHFEQHNAWADYEDSSCIDKIVSWGVSRTEVIRALEATGYSDEYYFPVLQTNPLPCFRFLKLKAHFHASDGTEFSGFIIGSNPYCVFLFLGNTQFGFNNNLPDLVRKPLRRLRQASGLSLKPFFPLHYRTEFRDATGRIIEGNFDCGDF